jgi:acetyltransferase-like isoleucine patch superfamily enzyme
MLFENDYVTEAELRHAGIRDVGTNVRIARNCSIVGLDRISIGHDVRIDSYCIIVATGVNAELNIGSYVHIGGQCYINGSHGFSIGDFAGLSQGCRCYSASDDYSGESLTNPTVPAELKHVKTGAIQIGRHAIVGSGSIIMPGVNIGDGAAIGALTFVNKSLEGWQTYFGSPAKRVGARSQKMLEREADGLERGVLFQTES